MSESPDVPVLAKSPYRNSRRQNMVEVYDERFRGGDVEVGVEFTEVHDKLGDEPPKVYEN